VIGRVLFHHASLYLLWCEFIALCGVEGITPEGLRLAQCWRLLADTYVFQRMNTRSPGKAVSRQTQIQSDNAHDFLRGSTNGGHGTWRSPTISTMEEPIKRVLFGLVRQPLLRHYLLWSKECDGTIIGRTQNARTPERLPAEYSLYMISRTPASPRQCFMFFLIYPRHNHAF
jgi:hypothetical protein